MALQQYRALLLVVTAVVALFVASPALQTLVVAPQTDHFTELWVFGPNHNATYPSNITSGESYHYYLDVANHLGSCGYYTLAMKFRNQSQSGPDSFNHTASQLAPLGTMTFFVANNQTLELPIDLSLQYSYPPNTQDYFVVQSVTLNGQTINVDSTTVTWDPIKKGFYGNLVFELYLYNDTANELQYNQRYLSLWLKMNV